jgi:hypothetical protein
MEADAEDAELVPKAFVAVTVNVYAVSDCNPATVIGEDAPVPVKPPGDDVAVNEVAALGPSGVKVTVAAPLLNALEVPTSVAVPISGADGNKKSFCARDFFPAFLFTAI